MAVRRLIRPGNLLLLAAAGLFVGWFLLLRPAFLGGPSTYVMISGPSMEPTLDHGDLVVARSQGDYRVGDIVAFHPPSKRSSSDRPIVIHRIVGGSAEEGFITQGDNNEAVDPWRLKGDDILGEMWFSAPGAGRFLAFLQAPVMLAGLAASIAVFLILSGEEKETKRPRPPSPSEAGRARRRFLPWRLPPWRGVGLGVLLLLALLVIPFAAYRPGKWR